MKMVKNYLISMLMAIVVLCSIATPASASSSYDAGKALTYAKAHWNDGKGLCAEFVSDCLNAGGCTVWSRGATTLARLLRNSSYGTWHELTFEKDGNIKVSKNRDKMSIGDPVFYYCPKCEEQDNAPYVHVVLYSGEDSNGNMKCYAHNRSKNNTVITLKDCGYSYKYTRGEGSHPNGPITRAYVYHMNESSSSNSNNPSSTSKNDVSLTVAKDYWEVSPGDQIKIDFTFTGTIAEVSYEITDPDVCKLVGGEWKQSQHKGYLMVKIESEGKCVIPIFLRDKNGRQLDAHLVNIVAEKSSTPTPSTNPATLTISPSSLSLDLSNKKSQEITVTASGSFPEGCKLYHSISNPNIATDDWSRCKDGKVFKPVITAKSTGETTLTCTAMKDEKVIATAQLKITVTGSVTPSTYTIRYDANGGQNAPASQTKTAQRALTLDRAQPARDGYTFAGWATSKDGSAQYQPGGQYTEDKDVTLYAVWKKTENKVSLTLAKTSFDIKAGDQAAIDFTFDGTVDSISYQIDDESICKYVDGEWKQSQHKGTLTVKAMSSGTTSTTIVLYDENDNVLASRTATITVSGRTPSVEEDPVTMTLYPYIDEVVPGSKVRLNFAFTGEVEGMFFDIADRSVFTDRGGELDFNQHMGYYEFEALSPGTTDITIILYEGEGASYKVLASETVSVTVKKSVAFYPSNPTPDYDPITVLSLDRTAMTLIAGGGYVEIHATSLLGNPVTWDTSESGIILLSYDDGSSAAITPIAPGTVTVTARTILNGKEYEANCVVTVMPEMSVRRIPGNDTIYTAPMGQ